MGLFKYPRTYHLPYSPNLQNDDRKHPDISIFNNKEIVITEKLDGENTTIYRNHIHARSLDSGYHISREWVKNLYGKIRYEIPENMRICGENMYAVHSIHYKNLKSYFYVFSIWENNKCLSWDETKEWCELLGLEIVPELYRGKWENKPEIKLSDNMEGYVIRIVDSFYHDFDNDRFFKYLAKYVRKNHVQTSKFWMFERMRKNDLI